MAGKTRHPERRSSSTRSSNVIRLRPRQWLETFDDLVPIGNPEEGQEDNSASPVDGSTAGRDASASNRRSRSRGADNPVAAWIGSGEGVVPIGGAPGDSPRAPASDFWGEHAASVQGALHAPAPHPDPDAPRRQFRRPSPRLPAVAPVVRRVLTRLEVRTPVRLTWPVAAALVASAVIIGGLIASAALTGASAARPGRTASRAHAGAFADPGKKVAEIIKMLTPAEIPPLAAPRAHRTRPRRIERHSVATPSRPTAVKTSPQPKVAPATPSPAAARSSSRHTDPASGRATGPSGVVSLIGAGTTPSG